MSILSALILFALTTTLLVEINAVRANGSQLAAAWLVARSSCVSRVTMSSDFLVSERGNKLLVHNNYLYRRDREYAGKTFWRCVEYDKLCCLGRAHTQNDAVTKFTDHNHEADVAKVELKRHVNKMRSDTRTSQTSPKAILEAVTVKETVSSNYTRILGCPLIFNLIKCSVSLSKTVNKHEKMNIFKFICLSKPVPTWIWNLNNLINSLLIDTLTIFVNNS